MAKVKERKDWRDEYFEGQMPVDEFLNKLLNSKDGDRTRRKAENKFISLYSGKLKPRI